jgi:hypothetical protein
VLFNVLWIKVARLQRWLVGVMGMARKFRLAGQLAELVQLYPTDG